MCKWKELIFFFLEEVLENSQISAIQNSKNNSWLFEASAIIWLWHSLCVWFWLSTCLCLSPTMIKYTFKCVRWDCWLGSMILILGIKKIHNFSSLFPKSLDDFLEISVLLILSGLKDSQWLFNHSFFIGNCSFFSSPGEFPPA